MLAKLPVEIIPKFLPSDSLLESWNLTAIALAHYTLGRHATLLTANARKWSPSRFADFLAMAFAEAVERGLKDQLISTYRVHEEASSVLRGRLNLSRQLRSCFHRPHLLECDVDQLDTNNPFNDVLKWAATVLAMSTNLPSLRTRLRHLSYALPGHSDKSASQRHIHLTPSPQFKVWSDALELARFLATGHGLSVGGGFSNGYSLIFNMERMFEQFVEVLLHRSVSRIDEEPFSTKSQVTTLYGVPTISGAHKLYCRPDNVVFVGDRPALLVDAKYKLIEELVDDSESRHRRPKGADVYALIVGMVAQGCSHGLLIYPMLATHNDNGDRLRTWVVMAFEQRLHITACPIDLLSLTSPSSFLEMENKISLLVRDMTMPLT
jgi:5-methylcytosine-specific restriction enzyme subunit McrC